MSGTDQLVDVSYRGLDVGKRLKLSDLGPTTAYLELPAPLPVGAELSVVTDEGPTLAVRVIRVHEQVAGAERAPGMRVQAERLSSEASQWWKERVSAEDPEIPEPPRREANGVPVSELEVDVTEKTPGPPEAAEAAGAEPADSADEPRSSGNGAAKQDRRPTTVMSAQEIREITDTASEGDGDGESNGDARENGKRRRRRRGGRKKRRT